MTDLTQKFNALEQQLATQHTQMLAKLDAVIAAIEGIQIADNSVSISAIAAALGTTADCLTGESVIGLLCRLTDGVIGIPNPEEPPPAVCPGFEGNPYAQSSGWHRGVTLQGPYSTYFAEWGGFLPSMQLTSSTVERAPGDGTSAVPVFQPQIDDWPVCITVETDGTDGSVEFVYIDVSDGLILPGGVLLAGANAAVINSEQVDLTLFMAGPGSVVGAVIVNQGANPEKTPTVKVWITSGEIA